MNPSLTTADSVRLFVREWPAREPRRGTVVIVHGLGEHIGRYEHVAAYLNGVGWNVVGYDHRGHGRSEGPKGALNTHHDLLRDLAMVIDAAREAHPGPLVLLGHSLGGVIASRFVAEELADAPADWSRPVDALVLTSPALDPGMNAAQKLMLSLAEPVTPNLAVNNGLNPAWVSRDPAVVQRYKDDPLVHDRITPKMVRFILDGGELSILRAPRWKVPTLLMWAGADKCVAPAGSQAFAAKAPKNVVSSREYPGLFHEILNEPEKGEVLDTLGAWLAGRGH